MTARLLFTAVVAVSMVVLFLPASGTPPLLPGLDKAVHLGLFAALALTGRRAAVPALGVGLVVYAVVSEVLQGVLALGRSADPVDALMDVVGIAAGLLVARWTPADRAAPTGLRGP